MLQIATTPTNHPATFKSIHFLYCISRAEAVTQHKGRVKLQQRRELKNQSCQENQDLEGTRSHPAHNRTKFKKIGILKIALKRGTKEVFSLIKTCRQRLVRDRGLQKVKMFRSVSKINNLDSAAGTEQPQPPHHTSDKMKGKNRYKTNQ